MKSLALAAGLLALLAVAPGVSRHTLHVGGLTRSYEVEVAANMVSRPALIVMLHGEGETGALMRRYKDIGHVTGNAAVIVYPDGIDHIWSVGRVAGSAHDDIGFLRRLIATTQAAYGTDPKRVYVGGISNGAMMALRVACQMPEVAAVAAVSGGLSVRWKDDCRPAHPISVLGIDGDRDPIFQYDGDSVGSDRKVDALSAFDTLATFARADQCGESPLGDTPSPPVADGTSHEGTLWLNCRGDAEVRLLTIDGGGHGWPGSGQKLPKRLVGTVSQAIDADAYVWDFFKSKSL